MSGFDPAIVTEAMSQSRQQPGHAADADAGTFRGDPWHAFGYIVSGVGLYGLLGWLVDRWLGTSFVVALGIVFGSVLGLYLTYSRFNAERPTVPAADEDRPTDPGTTMEETR